MYNRPNNQYNYGGKYMNPNNQNKRKKSRSRSPRNDYQVPNYNQGQNPQSYYQGSNRQYQYYQNPTGGTQYGNPGYNYGNQVPNYGNQYPGYGNQYPNYGNQYPNTGYGYVPPPPTNKNDINAISQNLNQTKGVKDNAYTYGKGGNTGGTNYYNYGNQNPTHGKKFSFGMGPSPGGLPVNPCKSDFVKINQISSSF